MSNLRSKFGEVLSREQMKAVVGGEDLVSCSCPETCIVPHRPESGGENCPYSVCLLYNPVTCKLWANVVPNP